MNEHVKERLDAEAAADSRGYVTDGRTRYLVVVACATIEIPFPWWTPDEEVPVPPLASVSDLLDAAPEKDR